MTAGTIRLERGITPVDSFGIALVTLGTRKIAAMIERLVRQSCMAVIDRRPGVGVMAQTTVLHGVEVPGVLSRRNRAVVAGRTGTEYLVVINGRYRLPGIRAMAVFADIRRLHVQWAFTGRIGSVVTAEAVVDNIGVVEIGRDPGNRRVAIVAVVATRYVRGVFPCGRYAIVAGVTGADDLGVIDCEYRGPDI